MTLRVFSEFDSADMAETAVRRVKGLFKDVRTVGIRPLYGTAGRYDDEENEITPFSFINSATSAINGFLGVGDKITYAYEPAESPAVILSLDIKEEDEKRITNLLTAMGGRHISSY